MKKITISVTAMIALMIGVIFFLQNVNFKRIGTEKYYVQIQEGKKTAGRADSGEKIKYYEYGLRGFDENGQEKTLSFTANKDLRKDAFLCLYVKNNGVVSYQEVSDGELPDQAKEKVKGLHS
ncbi:YxeA family protein [Paenibacillus dokdonensis]|uniref:YxeA family protein n=1 Tax=Paenibacillus dokdonensis TaxID=2567944 RepID=A0ABU6GV68_9BACL|nr:YxeA family protein [Paenibacillus dokdonensis]MEC0243603.1 YxeA family protein [Paenibacillus dokdonensis]